MKKPQTLILEQALRDGHRLERLFISKVAVEDKAVVFSMAKHRSLWTVCRDDRIVCRPYLVQAKGA